MTIYEAATHKVALLKRLKRARRIEIDLSGVTEMDTAGVQLLVMVKREATTAGKEVVLSAHSRAVLEVFDCYRMERA